jgi:cellobiose phosphorylase
MTERLSNRSGLAVEINRNGSIRKIECQGVVIGLFLGNEIEGGPANVYLRRLGKARDATPLLGPSSPTTFQVNSTDARVVGHGSWHGVSYRITLQLAQDAPTWFWHVELENTASAPVQLDLTHAQDLALASYGAVRLNEFYVSQYLDHTPLDHPTLGLMTATRQNQAVEGRNPWCLIGSLRKGVSFATDALQFHGLQTRGGNPPAGLTSDLPSRRLQHEHSLVVVRDEVIRLEPGGRASAGFFGSFVADHPDATTPADVARAEAALALNEARAPQAGTKAGSASSATASSSSLGRDASGANASLFSPAPILGVRDLDTESVRTLFSNTRRHEEKDDRGKLLSFFYGDDRHVVLRAKELRVMRPHGHLLRTGQHTTPDESALTSTAWMNGVFHSMVTQGHVSINRFLSTVHSYLGLFRSQGQRVFVEVGGKWQLLDVPSAFEIAPERCHWIYRHDGGLIQVCAEAQHSPHALTLSIEVIEGPAARFLISHHVALNGDDGSTPGAVRWRREGEAVLLSAAPGGDVGNRFPDGTFEISPVSGTKIEKVGGDELLFRDGRSREEPFLCLITAAASAVHVQIRGHLIPAESQNPLRADDNESLIPLLSTNVPATATGDLAQVAGLADLAPWLTHNALVHYLSPRGLEQYSGGGWGTRDVCQGPVEMLMALGRLAPIRDLLLRVMKQQNPDGDWPQWFMFFERERNIRPGDSHGDIVFWPVLVLAQYLLASGDADVLNERVPFFESSGPDAGERATVWEHAQRALAVIRKRVIPGTALAAYGHGDWNDSLQPANPLMRERLCSAWTVTLHYQTLKTLALALKQIGRANDASSHEQEAAKVLKDFQRLLVVDGVLTGYAMFDEGGKARHLLHPSDDSTGVHYSALGMIHAILEDMLTPEQIRAHLQLIDSHLSGPDGVRLFDRPMTYHGGPQRLFQRAETATYFGREIGLMYMHAHLRYAQAMAHIGEADRFFRALCQANPIGIRSIVPPATLRQANCYYSSSDAAFADRLQASAEYDDVARGKIALDGGWRVYSSGAGIALGLIIRRFLGLTVEHDALSIDPVMPATLDGLKVNTTLRGRPLEVQYRIGSAGCGVGSVTLNGKALSITHRENPHRRGAAQVTLASFEQGLTQGHNALDIVLG